jgi:hypothetical protein
VSEDEERPEHGALDRPVERPHGPAVEPPRGGGERGHDGDVAGDVGERAEGALAPAVGGHGGAHVADAERRRLCGVELGAVVLGGLAAGLLLLPLLPHCRRGHGWVDGSARVWA